MTLTLIGKGLVLEGWPSKIGVSWVLGIIVWKKLSSFILIFHDPKWLSTLPKTKKFAPEMGHPLKGIFIFQSHPFFRCYVSCRELITPWKTNMDTQNDGLEKVHSGLKYGHVWYRFVRFLGCKFQKNRDDGFFLRFARPSALALSLVVCCCSPPQPARMKRGEDVRGLRFVKRWWWKLGEGGTTKHPGKLNMLQPTKITPCFLKGKWPSEAELPWIWGSRCQRNPGLRAIAKGSENQWDWNICWMFFLFPGFWSNATKKFELFFNTAWNHHVVIV